MSLTTILPKIAERVIRTHDRILFIMGPWDQMGVLIDLTRTAIVQYATQNGRDASNGTVLI